MRLRLACVYWILVALGCLILPAVAGAADGRDMPLVFAHFMHCYVRGAIVTGVPDKGAPARSPLLEAWPDRSQESQWFAPDLPGDGIEAIRDDFKMAQDAGLDAMGMILGPKMLPRSQYSGGLNMVATTASEAEVKLIPELWGDPWSEDYTKFGRDIKDFMDAHPNAFLTRNGKPIIIFAFDSSQMFRAHAPVDSALPFIDAFLAPWGGRDKVYIGVYVPYDLMPGLLSPLVAAANAVAVWTPEDDWSALHSGVVFEIGKRKQKDVMFPIAPAFYQRRAGGAPMEYGNAFGAARYIDAWQRAIRNRPPFIDIQTWNDFSEDTQIMPSNTSGDTRLRLTRYFTQWFKTGAEPPVEEERVLLFHPKQLATARLDDPTALSTNAAWRHHSPTVDYIDVVTWLKSPATLRVTVGQRAWEQAVPAGFHEWVIYAPQSTQPPPRKGEALERPDSYPWPNSRRSVTIAPQFSAAIPELRVSRDGGVVSTLVSRCAFVDHGAFQDFTVIGDDALIGEVR